MALSRSVSRPNGYTGIRRLQGLLLTLYLLGTLTTIHASPLFLAKKRAGLHFSYSARHSTGASYDAMLENTSTDNYPYVYTEAMNTFLKDLFAQGSMSTVASSTDLPTTFNACAKVNAVAGTENEEETSSGCVKTLLHAGIASDCASSNPICCALYWRYPANLSVSLPSSQIDPWLLFWNGAQAVNGFFTNFSDAYRTAYGNCAVAPTWLPASSSSSAITSASGFALAVDAAGEWRFTRRARPTLSFVETLLVHPTGDEVALFATLKSKGSAAWSQAGQFGNIPVAAPIVVCAVLVVCTPVLLLMLYYCCVTPHLCEVAAQKAEIAAQEEKTQETEIQIMRRRTSTKRPAWDSSRHSSFAAPSTVASSSASTASPAELRRTGSGKSTSSITATRSARLVANVSLSSIESESSDEAKSTGRRTKITLDHRRSPALNRSRSTTPSLKAAPKKRLNEKEEEEMASVVSQAPSQTRRSQKATPKPKKAPQEAVEMKSSSKNQRGVAPDSRLQTPCQPPKTPNIQKETPKPKKTPQAGGTEAVVAKSMKRNSTPEDRLPNPTPSLLDAPPPGPLLQRRDSSTFSERANSSTTTPALPRRHPSFIDQPPLTPARSASVMSDGHHSLRTSQPLSRRMSLNNSNNHQNSSTVRSWSGSGRSASVTPPCTTPPILTRLSATKGGNTEPRPADSFDNPLVGRQTFRK